MASQQRRRLPQPNANRDGNTDSYGYTDSYGNADSNRYAYRYCGA